MVPLEPLFKGASHPEPNLRIQALEMLSEHGQDPRVSELLATLVRSDQSEEVRENA